jgi:hypothetical protein
MSLLTTISSADFSSLFSPARQDQSIYIVEEQGVKQDSLDKINLFSLDDLDMHESLLDANQQSSIRALTCTRKWAKYNDALYIGNALICSATNFHYYKEICHCGTKGSSFKYTPCGKWKYCNRCANIRRISAWKKYSGVFLKTVETKYFVTITKSTKVNFTEGNYSQINTVWDELNTYVSSMSALGMISGAFVTEECSIDSLYPAPMLNPHLHIICTGSNLISHTYRDIKVHVQPITSQKAWDAVIVYPIKAINLYHTYREQWTRTNATIINRNLRDTLEAHRHTTMSRRAFYSCGTFEPRNPNCIVPTLKQIKKKSLLKSKKKLR